MSKYLNEAQLHLRMCSFIKVVFADKTRAVTILVHFLFMRFLDMHSEDTFLIWKEIKALFKEQITTLSICLFPKCAFSCRITSLLLYGSSKTTIFHLLSARVYVQSLPSDNCTRSESTVTEMGCAMGEILSSHVTNAKQCPGAILVVRDFWSPPLPGRAQCNPQILALPLIPSPGCPSGLGSMTEQLGVSERAKEAKRETFPQEHGGVIHRDTVPVHH